VYFESTMRRHSLLHRIVAVLSGTLLLQLSWLASGTLCRMPVDRGMETGMAATVDANGQTMHTADRSAQNAHASNAVAAIDASRSMPAGGCDMAAINHSCGGPWSPGGCTTMSSCASAAAVIAPDTPAIGSTMADRALIVAFAAIPLGPALAPELPPPRA
jgi:hypothetical protein